MKGFAYAALAAALGVSYVAGTQHFGFAQEAQAQPPAPAAARVRPPIPTFGKYYYVILTTATGDGSEAQKYLDAHFLYQADLEKRGITFGAGPLTEVDDGGRIGLIIVRANSREEARKIADSDPEHMHKARTYKLYTWMLNEGQIGVRVNLSDGKIVLE
jgi:uncharacterized protein YciI